MNILIIRMLLCIFKEDMNYMAELILRLISNVYKINEN